MGKTTLFAFTSSHASTPMLMSLIADSKFLVAEPVFCSMPAWQAAQGYPDPIGRSPTGRSSSDAWPRSVRENMRSQDGKMGVIFIPPVTDTAPKLQSTCSARIIRTQLKKLFENNFTVQNAEGVTKHIPDSSCLNRNTANFESVCEASCSSFKAQSLRFLYHM